MDPYVQMICKKVEGLEYLPGDGFARQIDVTVEVALLIHWAARDKKVNTAACVRHDNTRDFGMNYNADDRVHHFSVPIYMFHFGCFAR